MCADRVAIYRNELLPSSETFIRAQAGALRRWSPILVGTRRAPDGLELANVEVQLLPRIEGWRERADFWLHRGPRAHARTWREMGVRLVHAHFATDAVDAWPAVKAAGLPMLVTLHGYDVAVHPSWWRSGRAGLRRRLFPARLARLARERRVRFLAVSAALREVAVTRGIARDRIGVHHVGIDTALFPVSPRPMADRPLEVLFVGRLVEKKGVATLIEALACATRVVPEAKLVVIGDGPLRGDLENLAAARGVQARFPGWASPEALQAHLASARLFCLPSIEAANGDREGFGLVLLEAQSAGVPVLTSALGGAQEGLLPDRSGHAFAPGDVEALAGLIGGLLPDTARLQAMSTQAARFAREYFELQRQTGLLERIYDEFVAETAEAAC